MSFTRDKSYDQLQTERVIRGERSPVDPDHPKRNWLGHYRASGTGGMDEALLVGATLQELEAIRGAVREHLRHYVVEHGLTVSSTNGVFRFTPEQT